MTLQKTLAMLVGVFLSSALALQAAPVLQVDVDHRSTTDLVPGFERITLDDGGYPNATKTFAGGIAVDIDPVGYSFSGHDRHRTSPSDYLSHGPLYRDFIYAPNDSTGLDATITGLTPNQEYRATIWSFDTGSSNPRVSDWSVQDARGLVAVRQDYTFESGVPPIADTDNRFTFRTIADGAGQIIIEGRGDPATVGTSPAVFLNALQLDEVGPPPAVLAVDINDRGAAGPANTQAGFEEFLLHRSEGTAARTTTRDLGSVRVTISGVEGNMDDRRRGVPTNSANYNEQELQRDFIFAQDVGGVDEQMDILVEGLAPGRKYLATVWSYDTSSNPARTSDWSANGTLVKDDYQFAGSQVPQFNGDSTLNFYAAADANGEMLITGQSRTDSSHGVFLDAFRLAEFEPVKTLAVDFNDRGAVGPGNTQSGFEEFVLAGSGSTSRVFGSAVVTLSGVQATLDDRRRSVPTNGGNFTQQELLRDFIFANNGSITDEKLDVRIEGLAPGQPYVASIWSFDDGSAPARTSQWSANGQVVREQYSFDGGALSSSSPTPPADGYSFRFYATADANGEILISGEAQAGTQPALFLNALQLAQISPADMKPAAYAQTVLNQKPLAYWRLNDAGPGLAAGDSSPNNNNDARYNDIYGSSINAPDPSGGFRGFEPVNTSAMMGRNSGITNHYPDDGLLNDGAGAYQMDSESGSVVMWVNVGQGIDGTSARVLFQGSDAARGGFSASAITAGVGTNTYGPTQAGRLIAKGGNVTGWGTEDIRNTGWRMVTLTWDGADVNLYLDGRRTTDARADVAGAPFDMTGQFRFGKATDRPYEGLMDEIAVYKRPLTYGQITALYNSAVDGVPRRRLFGVDIGANGHPVQDGFETFELPTSPPAGDHSRTYGNVTVTLAGPLNGARTRGAVAHTLGDLARSFVFATDEVNLVFSDLPGGLYELVTYHHDQAAQQKYFDILVSDALGADVAQDLDVRSTTGSNPNDIASGFVTFTADGFNDVTITFRDNGLYTRQGSVVPLSGFELTSVMIPEPATMALVALAFGAVGLRLRRRRMG